MKSLLLLKHSQLLLQVKGRPLLTVALRAYSTQYCRALYTQFPRMNYSAKDREAQNFDFINDKSSDNSGHILERTNKIIDEYPILMGYLPQNIKLCNYESLSQFLNQIYNAPYQNDKIQVLTTILIFMAINNLQSTHTHPKYKKVNYDIKNYVRTALNFPVSYLTLAIIYNKIVPYMPPDFSLSEAIFQRAIQNFSDLSLSDLSFLCLNNRMILQKRFSHREIRHQFYSKLETYVHQNQQTIIESGDRKSVLHLIQGLSDNQQVNPITWEIIQNVLFQLLKQDVSRDCLTKEDLLSTIDGMTYRKSQSVDIWKLLVPQVIKQLNTRNLTLQELAKLTYQLYILKFNSPKLFEFLYQYFMKQGYTITDLQALSDREVVNFFHSLAQGYGDLNSPQFFGIVKSYLDNNYHSIRKFRLMKCIDLFKYWKEFKDQDLKLKMYDEFEREDR